MTSWLGYLVERSVRSRPPAAAGAAPGVDDGLAADARAPSLPASRPGMIRPRIRSRHEPWPQVTPSDPDAFGPTEEIRESPAARGAEVPLADPPEEASVMERTGPRTPAPLTIRPKDASPAVAARRTAIERRDAQRPEPEMGDPADVAIAVDEELSRPDRHRASAHHTSAVAREDRQMALEALAQSAEPTQPTRRPSPAQQGENASPSEADRPRGVVNPVSRAQAPDVASPTPDRPERREDSSALRAPVALSPVVSPRTTSAPSAPPRIEVTIGRVEVRAVYAPPSPGPARKPPSLPTTSLDDYLKQRDRSA
jgi:hypothetical protein